jgi:hypothetical protein
MASQGTLRTCKKGHSYSKSTDCPTCPVCEREKSPKAEFLATLSAPARRAFEQAGILTLEKVSNYTEKEILALHGVGPSAIPNLKEALEKAGLRFKQT